MSESRFNTFAKDNTRTDNLETAFKQKVGGVIVSQNRGPPAYANGVIINTT